MTKVDGEAPLTGETITPLQRKQLPPSHLKIILILAGLFLFIATAVYFNLHRGSREPALPVQVIRMPSKKRGFPVDPMETTVLIAEDDPAMRHILRKALEELPDVKVIGEADNGLEAIRMVKEMAPQVVFLDIAMPEKDGLEAAREICDVSPGTILIFATAHEDFTHEAFAVYAFDYLIKPFKIDRIRKTMERVRIRLPKTEQVEVAPHTPQAETNLKKILVKEEGKKIFLSIEDIVFLTREGRSVIIRTIEGKIKTTETMEALEQKLAGNSFFRCHSYLAP